MPERYVQYGATYLRQRRDHGAVRSRPSRVAAAHDGDTRRTTVVDTYNGYCVKCKAKRDFQGEVVVSDSGRRMAKGICPVCGTKMNRILGKA
jgi:hypothetical protein